MPSKVYKDKILSKIQILARIRVFYNYDIVCCTAARMSVGEEIASSSLHNLRQRRHIHAVKDVAVCSSL